MRLVRGYIPSSKNTQIQSFYFNDQKFKIHYSKKKILVRGFSFDACTFGLLASHSCMPVAHSIIAEQVVMHEISYE